MSDAFRIGVVPTEAGTRNSAKGQVPSRQPWSGGDQRDRRRIVQTADTGRKGACR